MNKLQEQRETDLQDKQEHEEFRATRGATYSIDYIRSTENTERTAKHLLFSVLRLIERSNYAHQEHAVTACEYIMDAITALDNE